MAKAKKTSPKSAKKKADKKPVVKAEEKPEEAVTEQVAEAIADEPEKVEVEQPPEPAESVEVVEKDDAEAQQEAIEENAEKIDEHTSVSADTHSKARVNKATQKSEGPQKRTWWQAALIATGLVLTLLIFVAGAFSQLYKGKALPSVTVAGMDAGGKSQEELQIQLDNQVKTFKVTLKTSKKTLTPSLKAIGLSIDSKKTIEDALNAKRAGLLSRFMFWQKQNVPAEVTVNNTILAQYLDKNLPGLTNAGQDARLEYSLELGAFTITSEKNGAGPDAIAVKDDLLETASSLENTTIKVNTKDKPAKITYAKLEKLLPSANTVIQSTVLLEGSAGTFQAQPADIAAWITPTPQKDGSVKLVIEQGKVQSYVESIGQQVSATPQDKKVIKDKKTGKVVVLQEGRDGTELADAAGLAAQITAAVRNAQDVTLQMNIKTAKAKTINLKGYDKWIEVDLTKQTTTAYEGATPLRTFVIASGLPGYETPTGEYAIWLKVRSQTMTGGSKADGSYYNIPNVEWVSYFYQDYALHGAWWRKVFGAPASHGCVNMTNADAQWVYNWAPVGTKVIVHY